MIGLSDGIVSNDHERPIFVSVVEQLMRFTRFEEKGVSRDGMRTPSFVANGARAGKNVVELPLRAVRVIPVWRRAGWYSKDLDVEWMTFHKVGRLRLARKRLRDLLIETETTFFAETNLFDVANVNDFHVGVLEENLEATGRFELPDGAFAELCLTTWLRRHNSGAGSGNRTHASTLGRSQATITSYPRAVRRLRPAPPSILDLREHADRACEHERQRDERDQ